MERTEYPDGSTEFYRYDCAGNMTSSTDGEGRTTQYRYNRAGKLSAIEDPMGGVERYRYDAGDRMVSRTDRNGVTVEYGYNLYGALLFKREKGDTLGEFYEYTPEGLLKCAISAGMRYAYEYDVMGRLSRKSASGRTLLALTWDKNGNKIRQTDVTGKVTEYEYSPLDQLLKVTDGGRDLAIYEYHPDGTVKSLTHGPIRQEYLYDADKNLISLRVQSGDEVLVENLYAYDGNGNRTKKGQLGGETLYHYDPLNQLVKVEYPGRTEELYYDKAYNRTRRVVDGLEERYEYDARNRLTAYTKGGVTTPFQYDGAGNLLTDGKARYTYDAFNRTEKVELFDGNVQISRYDAEGLRCELEENGRLVQFIFNPDREVVTEESDGQLTRLIRGTELIARSTDAARTYYHYASDEMGSTTHITDEDGRVQNRYEYDAWGNLTHCEEQVPNRYKYTGQQLDPMTQQYYLRARFYNPVVGRFTQEDTYRGDGLNLYAYCANNPVYYTDPSGYDAQNYTPQDYANFFSMDFGGPLSQQDMEDIAFMLYDDLRSKRLTRIDGTPMNRDDRSRTLDVAIDPRTGRMYWGLSGATDNHTRHPDGLPEPLQRLVDPSQNHDILNATRIDPDSGRRTAIDAPQGPGDCAEYSSSAHIYNSGEYLNDYLHTSIHNVTEKKEVDGVVVKTKVVEVQKPCSVCEATIVSSEGQVKINELVYGQRPGTSNEETRRSFNNPRGDCP